MSENRCHSRSQIGCTRFVCTCFCIATISHGVPPDLSTTSLPSLRRQNRRNQVISANFSLRSRRKHKALGGASKRGTQGVTRSTAQAHEMGDSQSSTRLLYFYEICRLLRRLALFSFRQPRVSLRYARLHPGLYADTRIRGLRIPRPHHLFQITFATRSYSWASVISRLMKSPGFAAKPSGTSLIST